MMNPIIDTAMTLSDHDLLARISVLAGRERETTVELVAHLAVLELRPNLYRAQGYGSLFRYCTGALRLSEDAACNRTKVTRACRDFPMILDLMAAGTVSLTTVKMLAPHLTTANHQAVLARAADRSREDIEALVAELAPQPDVKASVRKLPTRQEDPSSASPGLPLGAGGDTTVALAALREETDQLVGLSAEETTSQPVTAPDEHPDPRCAASTAARPVVRASAPGRYRVQFTIDRETYDELRAVQALLRREIPNGDPGRIFGRALRLLKREVESAKFAVTSSTRQPASQPRKSAAQGATHERRIRPRTDDGTGNGISKAVGTREETPSGDAVATAGALDGTEAVQERRGNSERPGSSRHIPNGVKRAVWWRDRGQCAFVSAGGLRCTERAYLDLHHRHPYALDGPATIDNIALRCRSHNQYESEQIFGPYGGRHVPEVDERPQEST
jgi:hypothetical protein